MDFAESAAFADYIVKVEDSRFKEAIFDPELPRPDRRFPAPPRGFNYTSFVQENNIDLTLLVNEVLGRFFLRQVSTGEEEIKALDFADALEERRKIEPHGHVPEEDILALCQRFDLQLAPLSKDVADLLTPSRGAATTNYGARLTTISSSVSVQATKRLTQGKVLPSKACLEANAQAQETIELVLLRAYEALTTLPSNKRLYHLYLQLKHYSMRPLGERSVRYHRALGMGAFGTVYGCVVSCLGTVLAIKVMNKRRIKAKRAMSQVTAERDALETLALHPSPFCLKLRYSFETAEAYHFLLPLAIGGDLQFHLRQGPFPLERARYYAAQVALGLGHLHSLGLVLRDLKPRNILLTSAGTCQISDFGLAVQLLDGERVKGRAGTEGYWSPEVINGDLYATDADWWSFGACLFEFLAGVCPFSAKHAGTAKRNDATRKGEIKFTQGFEESAKPLVLTLLDLDLNRRVKTLADVLDVERWEFWRGFDLESVKRNEMPAPWLPEPGKIYAVSQGEIKGEEGKEEAAAWEKLVLLPSDAVEFEAFVDYEGHQRDICKVLRGLAQDNKLESALQGVNKSCCLS